LAQLVAARSGLFTDANEPQADLLRRLRVDGNYPRNVLDLFHQLRMAGNAATHRREGDHATALGCLKMARQLAIWFYRTFEDQHFKAGPFQPPRPPIDATAELTGELSRLRAERDAALSEAQRAKAAAADAEAARFVAERGAQGAADERALWEQLATDAEAAKNQLAEQLASLQAAAEATPPAEQQQLLQFAQTAAEAISLDEAETRALIDEQLRERGWEVDSKKLRYANGVRPVRGKAMAIAEWPTANGPADYALFIGTTCLGLVEAKRKRKNVQAAIDQTGRYAQGFKPVEGIDLPAGGPWPFQSGPTDEPPFRVPFLFATNGRPYLKQVETQSGIWFRDARDPTNLRRALTDWPTPEGLKAQLEIDRQKAQERLKSLPIEFGFPLRECHQRAIRVIESALADDARRTMLLAMATGTGKTKLAIALLYRLLETKRFRRVCFVVDRHALGEQAATEFKTTRIVSVRTFADIFGLKELADVAPDTDTKVHICTIQGLVKRVLFADEPQDVPPVDQYDLMVVDECHRGYLLDREMSDREMSFRSEADYISKYRRVLEHFDAVKIGLTATPALHTVQIFGEPIFTYSYCEAVIDGYLVDHEPPIHIENNLARQGIRFARGEQLSLLDPVTGQIDLTHAPDDLNFAIDDFNRRVITRPFNQVVCEELAKHIDPTLPGKTLIFAATDGHADIVVDELKKAFARRYGGIDDAAVAKITGSVDDPGRLIRRFRNDATPIVAVTVDLLTTGIDVPKIVNLVFIRRVNSRILYEQMLGRATRLCPEIDKETFRIFDAVGIYEALQPLTSMKPVAVNPKLTLTQLLEEFTRLTDHAHRAQLRDEILVKLRHRLRSWPPEAQEAYEVAADEPLQRTVDRLQHEPLEVMAKWVKSKTRFSLSNPPTAALPMRSSHWRCPWPDRVKAAMSRITRRSTWSVTYQDYVTELTFLLFPLSVTRSCRIAPHPTRPGQLREKPGIRPILDWQAESGRPVPLPISVHPDKVVSVTHGYEGTTKPEDFLSSFARFVRDNENKIVALQAVVQCPRALTRADLKALRLELDKQGFSEAALRHAWKQAKNEDIAASVVGFIRCHHRAERCRGSTAFGRCLALWRRYLTAKKRYQKSTGGLI
jgi:type I restriction enzyme, R subunit